MAGTVTVNIGLCTDCVCLLCQLAGAESVTWMGWAALNLSAYET